MLLIALFRLAFATVLWLIPLNLATSNNSPAHYAKGTSLGIPVARRRFKTQDRVLLKKTCALSFGHPSTEILNQVSYLTWHSPMTACRYTVSGTISLCFRSTFHLSLTVLVHYRSKKIFSLRRWSSQIQTGFLVSRPTQVSKSGSPFFRLQGYHLL